MIMPCPCKNAFQDERYGEGRRVFNRCQGLRPDDFRCSSCGHVVTVSRAVQAAAEKKK